LDVFQRVEIRRIETVDSSATPKGGVVRREPNMLAAADLERLRTRLASVVERAHAEDPRELRRRIAALERAQTSQIVVERRLAGARTNPHRQTAPDEPIRHPAAGLARTAEHEYCLRVLRLVHRRL
jgi:hypothetical protein